MPQYMLLIYGPVESPLTEEQRVAQMPQWFSYTQGLRDSGAFVAGDPLYPVSAATTVRERDGETQITDGPFAETKEFLGGYYVIDVPDLDAAIAATTGMPILGYGSVEVRPIVDMAAMGAPDEEPAQAQA